MANNREERRSGKDWVRPEERIVKRANIKDNFIIILLILSTFMNVTLTYSLINLNTNVSNFMADIFYNTPVNQQVADENSPHIHGSQGELIYLTKDEEHGDKYYYIDSNGEVIYPDEAQIEFPVTVNEEQPDSEYISDTKLNGEPAGAHVHTPDGGTATVEKDADGKYFYIDADGKTVYPGNDAVH